MTGKTAKTAGVADCHGIKIPDSPLTTPERLEEIRAGTFQETEINAALAIVKPGDRVLILGTGIGLISALVAKTGKAAKVLCYDGSPGLLPHVAALLKLNRLTSKTELHAAVLTTDPKPAKTVARPPGLFDAELGKQPAKVPTARFDKVMKDFKPDVLLLNMQGAEREFLAEADLTGIRAMAVGFTPGLYGKPGMRECKAALGTLGFVKISAHSTRQVWACEHKPEVLAPQPDSGWSTEMITLDKPSVVPPADQGFEQPAGVIAADGSYVARGTLWRNGRTLTTAPALPKGKLPLRKGTWLWGGVLWMHFGHFLTESTSRLWALDHLEEEIDGVLFIPKRPRNKDEVAGFQKDFLDLLRPGLQLACAGGPERVEKLIVPGQGFGLGELSVGTAAYRATMAKNFAREITPDGPEKLYISRSELPTGRGNLVGERALEKNLRARGYTIYHPQKHDLRHQIATYKAARKVIAAEGSALHLLAFVAHPDTEVAMVVRRPSGATRNIERHLTAFMGRPPVAITQLNRSWKPLGKARPRLWMGELDMPAVQTELTRHGFIGKGKKWSALDPADVAERLGDKFEEVA